MLGAIIGDIAGSKYEFNNVRTEEFEFMSRVESLAGDLVAQKRNVFKKICANVDTDFGDIVEYIREDSFEQ